MSNFENANHPIGDQQPQRSCLETASEVDVRYLVQTITKRQKQVAMLIFNEYSNKQIAHVLGTSPKTVEAHRKEVIRRLGCSSTIGLVRRIFQIMQIGLWDVNSRPAEVSGGTSKA